MSEAAVQQEVRLALGRLPGVRMFRNNVGTLLDRQGRPVKFGLHPGSADLIGWKTVLITKEMVGTEVAVFASIEVKSGSGRMSEAQSLWAKAVYNAGGISATVRDVDSALMALGIPK